MNSGPSIVFDLRAARLPEERVERMGEKSEGWGGGTEGGGIPKEGDPADHAHRGVPCDGHQHGGASMHAQTQHNPVRAAQWGAERQERAQENPAAKNVGGDSGRGQGAAGVPEVGSPSLCAQIVVSPACSALPSACLCMRSKTEHSTPTRTRVRALTPRYLRAWTIIADPRARLPPLLPIPHTGGDRHPCRQRTA